MTTFRKLPTQRPTTAALKTKKTCSGMDAPQSP
jgi:hypothetical protein